MKICNKILVDSISYELGERLQKKSSNSCRKKKGNMKYLPVAWNHKTLFYNWKSKIINQDIYDL